MKIHSLGYLALTTTDVAAWREFAVDVLGLMPGEIDDPDHLWLRVDDRCQRIVVTRGDRDGLDAPGWEVRDDIAFEWAIGVLDEFGVAWERSAELATARGVADLVRFTDPSGNPGEIFWGMRGAASPFVSSVGVSGFVTGDQGLGHVVLPAENFDATDRFYRRGLRFGLSDFADMGPVRGHFLHTNRRHHSLALIGAPRDAWFVFGGLIHLMLQVRTLTDVGLALARVAARGIDLFESLGEHGNDRMTSFYVHSPSGFPVEYGAGAIEVDPETWTATCLALPDIWGHEVFGAPTD